MQLFVCAPFFSSFTSQFIDYCGDLELSVYQKHNDNTPGFCYASDNSSRARIDNN